MSTVLGIKANSKKKGIVLFADTQLSYPKSKPKRKDPWPGLKIYTPNDYCALAYTGDSIDSKDIKKLLRNRSRRSAEELQRYLKGGVIPGYSRNFESVEFLIGLRLDDLELYYVKGTRTVAKIRKYIAIGDGDDYANKVLRKNLKGEITLEKALEIGYRAEKFAFQSLYTGYFMNFLIITKNGMDRTGMELTKQLLKIEKNAIEKAKRHYRT